MAGPFAKRQANKSDSDLIFEPPSMAKAPDINPSTDFAALVFELLTSNCSFQAALLYKITLQASSGDSSMDMLHTLLSCVGTKNQTGLAKNSEKPPGKPLELDLFKFGHRGTSVCDCSSL